MRPNTSGHRNELTDLMQMLSAPLRLGSANLRKKVTNEVDWLFDVYKQHTGHQPMCGGAQNLVLGRADPYSANSSNSSYFQRPILFEDLPVPLQLYIFSLLTPADLCRACQVNRKWRFLCSDEMVWRRILSVRSQRWLRIHDDKNPDFFKKVCPDMDSKQIYLKCHPHNAVVPNFRMPNFFQLLSSTRPRIIMFGPGLESLQESSIVRSILTDRFPDLRQRFEVTGMVPGEFAGVGSGISLRFDGFGFNLVTLYSNVKSVRQDSTMQKNRVDHNKLFVRGGDMFEVSPPVQELCRKTAAFIYVVDAMSSFDLLSLCQPELFAMSCEMWSPDSAPLLVVGASGLGMHHPLPAIDIVRALRLGRLKRKWMVQSTDIQTLAGFRGGVHWLLSSLH